MLTIIGLKSGTSADGIDVALVSTDGSSKCRLLDSHFASYRDSTRAEILLARDDPAHYLADAAAPVWPVSGQAAMRWRFVRRSDTRGIFLIRW